MCAAAANPPLFAIYQDYLRAQGVEPQQIIAINFEDLDFED